ncbi:MAG TPA: radical SAM protein, partial [Verrucomicrobiae bacterium]|nr:radical SAM protein [Verrucomicrobiae bacterium]
FLDEAQALYWAKRSIDFAFSCGATAASLIPTRPGNGALDELAARGEFAPPTLATVEAAAEYGVGLRQGRVFTDLWDIGRIATCPLCGPARVERLRRANLNQVLDPPVPCSCE